MTDIEDQMNVVHTEEEPIYFDHYDPNALHYILDTQHKNITYMKNHNYETNKAISDITKLLVISQMIQVSRVKVKCYIISMYGAGII